MPKQHTLVSPDGVEYQTSDVTEVTRLKARGYTDKADKPAAKSEKK